MRIRGFLIGMAIALGVMSFSPTPSHAQAAEQVQQARQACREGRGDASACVEYGLALYTGVTVAKDEAAAARVWRAACERGNAQACSNLAYVLRHSETVPHDEAEAVRLFLTACEGRVAGACLAAGYMLRDGVGAPVDLARARGRFNYACIYGSGVGCREEGSMYYEGRGGGQSFGDALNMYRSACSRDDAAGCGLVGWMAARGEGMAQDFSLAVRQYKRACAMGEQTSCNNLELYRSSGEGGAGYAELLAFEARERAIPSTLPQSERYLLASAAMQNGNTALALAGFEVLSEEGMADAAFNLGQMYWHGLGVPMDRPKAVRHFERAANAHHPHAQFIMAHFYHTGFVVGHNPIWAIQTMRAAAEAGIAEADPIWRAWQNDREAYFDERDRVMREMARENEESAARAEAANMARIWSLYSGSQNQQQNGQVCGMIYRNNQANQECMARETFDRYYNPAYQ